MDTRYEIKLVARSNKTGRLTTVEHAGYDAIELAQYHEKRMNEFIKSSYFNENYTDAEIKITDTGKQPKPWPSTTFETIKNYAE